MGMKFMPNQFLIFLDNARRFLKPTNLVYKDAELVEIFFPSTKYIHLERKNKLKQAISYSKALQDGIWREAEGEDEKYKNTLHLQFMIGNILSAVLTFLLLTTNIGDTTS